MSKLNTFACKQFTEAGKFAYEHTGNANFMGFYPEDYSRFKYGSKSIARKFGRELAESFIESETFQNMFEALNNPNGVIIYPAPYNFIPTATFALKDYFIAAYNEIVIPKYGFKPLIEGKIGRLYSYNSDYGAMSKEERDAAISGDDFYIDVTQAEGKTLIYLDDIRITGSHEERIRHLANKTGLDKQPHVYLYFAQLMDPENADPKVENYLNYYAVKNLLDINNIVKNDEFIFNTRVVKYILAAPSQEFEAFIDYQSRTFRNTLLHYTYGNSYHNIEEYKRNIGYLLTKIESDNQNPYHHHRY